MKKNLVRLFDYQRFECNPDLQKIISDVEKRYGLNKQGEKEKHTIENDYGNAGCGTE